MHGHAQNLSYDKYPTWRHGRGWWAFGRGEKTPWSAEWCVFYRASAPGLKFGRGGGDEGRVFLHVVLPYFAVYLSREFRRPSRTRSFDLSFHAGCLWYRIWGPDCFARDRRPEKERPWWERTHHLRVVEWFTGRPRCAVEKGEPFDVFVPMPEGCYRAVATRERRTWTYRFGVARVSDDVWLEIPGGIGHRGKGENSYDCGDDALCGIGGETVEKAIGNAVATALKSRRRYGHDSKRTGAAPARVVNAEVIP